MRYLLLLTLALLTLNMAAVDAPPNVVIILADDLGYGDLGCYGSPISIPHRKSARPAVPPC